MLARRPPFTGTAPRSLDRGDVLEDTIPKRIVLDDASFAEFCSEMANPRPPNAALRALFKK